MSHRLKSCCLFLTALAAAHLHAQIHKVAPPEKVTRAIAVYEYTGDLARPTAARIVPVTLFINAKLEDAGTYLIRPMPFVLQTGDIYSLEQSGRSIGTVDIDYARNILPPGSTADVAAVGAWYGYGNFNPPAQPKPTNLKASNKIPLIDGALPDNSDDETPHFVGKQPGDGNSETAGNRDSTTTKTTASTPNPAPPDDPDRPTLHRPASSTTGTASTPAPTTGTVPDDDPDRPTLRHRDAPPPDAPDQPKAKKQKQSDSTVIPMSGSLNDDPDRPTLQRGKPLHLATAPELHSLPADLHQITAVSDAANRDEHLFARTWETHTEHAETLAKIQPLAQQRLQNYLTTYKLTAPNLDTSNPTKPSTNLSSQPNSSSQPKPSTNLSSQPKPSTNLSSQPKPSTNLSSQPRPSTNLSSQPKPSTNLSSRPKRSAVERPAVPSAPLKLEDEQLTAYTLSYGGLPTFVYTAESPITTGGPVYITLVVQRLPSNDYQLALSNVTDASHLDRTPWLRLIDAVDPDASHRASLLFELRAQTTRQFALYRLVTAHAEQQFATNPIQ